ncbi:uncharacterized protein MYCGRDRAFT_89379 [Zymoseptoria tritici IPO323]|uniref:Protein kinase domain-containing protein n=1 Tax=Zymoseptoria tritici (strain CBS 115943 / IPO323) TaxID=336722 RepID=F9WZ84_ZYMTI|nr:uncharacterized protein MYCGRDRAFT_89379 [Zymoseptoria tritici IPO323]EGP92353.1 hypothetical protein MYCGRDRAFT_89379 [Zymoseptoria tritici IPO323]
MDIVNKELPSSIYNARFERDHYIIKELGSGAYGHAYASVPKATADQIVSELTSSPNAVPAAKARLRAGLQAAKISKASTGFHDADSVSNTWLTLEMLNGRTLAQFATFIEDSYCRSPPAGLCWHMLFELAEALLTLHCGFNGKKGKVAPDRQKYAHNDVAGRNIMFRTAPSTTEVSFRDYPGVVLVDFGSAQKVASKATDEIHSVKHRGVDHQALDLKEAIIAIKRIFLILLRTDVRLRDALKELSSWTLDKDDAKADESLLNHLLQLRDQALKARTELYKPLPPRIVAYFNQHAQVVDKAIHGQLLASWLESEEQPFARFMFGQSAWRFCCAVRTS